jgi:hypothetical protein
LYLHLRDDPTIANTITVPPNAATLSRNNAAGVTGATAAAHAHTDGDDR